MTKCRKKNFKNINNLKNRKLKSKTKIEKKI